MTNHYDELVLAWIRFNHVSEFSFTKLKGHLSAISEEGLMSALASLQTRRAIFPHFEDEGYYIVNVRVFVPKKTHQQE
jgi:hypothetical protein